MQNQFGLNTANARVIHEAIEALKEQDLLGREETEDLSEGAI